MTHWYSLVAAVALAAPVPEPKPEDVVRTAISAAGGPEVLNRFPAGRVSAKGVILAGGKELPVTVEQVFDTPGRMRTVIRCEAKGQWQEIVQVVNGPAVRQTLNGRLLATSEHTARELALAVTLLEISQLTPVLIDRKFNIKPDKQAKGGPTAGVLVQVKGLPDLRLGFDRQSGHLVRIARRGPNPDTGKDGEFEQVLSDFTTVGGLTRPTRSAYYRDGVKVLELTTTTFTPLEKVDPKEFAAE